MIQKSFKRVSKNLNVVLPQRVWTDRPKRTLSKKLNKSRLLNLSSQRLKSFLKNMPQRNKKCLRLV